MSIKVKRRLSIMIIFVLLLSSTMAQVVWANPYSSFIEIGWRSSVTGAYRDYNAGTVNITNTVTSLGGYSTTGNNYCNFELEERKLFGTNTIGTRTQNLRFVGSSYSSSYTVQSSGSYRFFIHNRYPLNDIKYHQVDAYTATTVMGN